MPYGVDDRARSTPRSPSPPPATARRACGAQTYALDALKAGT